MHREFTLLAQGHTVVSGRAGHQFISVSIMELKFLVTTSETSSYNLPHSESNGICSMNYSALNQEHQVLMGHFGVDLMEERTHGRFPEKLL